MSKPLAVYGAGGHGKVVAEILRASGQQIAGFLDDNPALQDSRVLNMPVFAAAEWLRQNTGAHVALGIGANVHREHAANQASNFNATLISAIHPNAIVSSSATVGGGVVIMPTAVLNADCRVADGSIVNTGAIVEHDVRIGRYAHLSPRSVTGGGAEVGEFVHIGMGAIILPGKRIGHHAVIGAGAVVVNDIPEHVIASGVPAQIHSHKHIE